MMLSVVIASWCASARAQASPGAPRAAIRADAGCSIVIEEVDARRVVYLEHTGPYWAVGPVLTRVRERMLADRESGPMFVTFTDGPANSAAGNARTTVGYFSEGNEEPPAPFSTATREPQVVASMLVQGRRVRPPRYTKTLQECLEAEGYVVAGPITEILPVGATGAADAPGVKIEAAVRAVHGAGLAQRGRAADSGRHVPTQRSDATTERIDSDLTPVSASEMALVNVTSAAPPEPEVKASVPDDEPLAALFERGQYVAIAGRLMPEDRRFPQALQLWFGQVVFRIRAIDKGLEQVYQKKHLRISALSDAIADRYDKMSIGFGFDPLVNPVADVESRGVGLSAEKRIIMNDLDKILGGISVRRIDGEAAAGELIGVVQRVESLVRRFGA